MAWVTKKASEDELELLDLPPTTAVDPASFPEDEYPVECIGCGYSLRGLPDGRCPECGREFARGVLLVEIYVRAGSKRSNAPGYLSMWSFLGLLFIGVNEIFARFSSAVSHFFDPNSEIDWLFGGYKRAVDLIAIWLGPILVVGFFIGLVFFFRSMPPQSKRAAVLDAVRKLLAASSANAG